MPISLSLAWKLLISSCQAERFSIGTEPPPAGVGLGVTLVVALLVAGVLVALGEAEGVITLPFLVIVLGFLM